MKLKNLTTRQLIIAAGVCAFLAGVMTSEAFGEEFRVPIHQLEGSYSYLQSRGPEPFDIGSCVSTVVVVRVEITGTHYMGWWDGDDVEDYYHGPKGGYLYITLNLGANSEPNFSIWTHFDTTGPFSRTLTFPASVSQYWTFLADGVSDLRIHQEGIYGWGTWTIYPLIDISSVTVSIEAERLIKIVSLSRDGTLCWTPTRSNGVTHVEFATDLAGSWTRVASTPSTNTCCNVTIPPESAAGFFRVCYSPE